VWAVLRFAGHAKQEDGTTIGIVGSLVEEGRLRKMFEHDAEIVYTSPGTNDLQLSSMQFFASRHVEVAARLEYMAEARGRPRPGKLHTEAEHEDPSGGRGGNRVESDAEFEDEDRLPGEEDAGEDAAADPDHGYRPLRAVPEEHMEDVLLRTGEVDRLARRKETTGKSELLQTFFKDHPSARGTVNERRQVFKRYPNSENRRAQEWQGAVARQRTLIESRKAEVDADRPAPSVYLPQAFSPTSARARPLRPSDMPRSPIDVATELIAKSGIWRSKEQYLATIFMLQPCQQLWEAALREDLSDLSSPATIARFSKGIQTRRLFLHGQGGSGKTYALTEVVIKEVLQFFGPRGVLAVAASNSAARLLRGKTMHAAGKLTRKQSLKARELKPNSRAKKALQREWETLVMLLGDEVSMASPPLLAGLSRRASHGRRDLLKLDMTNVLEQPFGQVLLQALAGDFMQLNPVCNHTLMEALLRRSKVPGVPSKVKEEDADGYAIFRKICENVVLFIGSHRFLDSDLPQLLTIMRTKGGARLARELTTTNPDWAFRSAP
jgi:hypothetical protein